MSLGPAGTGKSFLAVSVAITLLMQKNNQYKISLLDKIQKIAKEIYGADEIIADNKIRSQLKQFEENGYGDFPICIAKTQYSFSTDPTLKGAPSGHSVPIRELRLSSGAGATFITPLCENMTL